MDLDLDFRKLVHTKVASHFPNARFITLRDRKATVNKVNGSGPLDLITAEINIDFPEEVTASRCADAIAQVIRKAIGKVETKSKHPLEIVIAMSLDMGHSSISKLLTVHIGFGADPYMFRGTISSKPKEPA